MRNGTAAPGQSQSLNPILSGFKISWGIGEALERPVIAAMGALFCRVTGWGMTIVNPHANPILNPKADQRQAADLDALFQELLDALSLQR